MFKKFILFFLLSAVVIGVVLLSLPTPVFGAGSKVSVQTDENCGLKISLSADQPIAGLGMAFKFAEPGDDVTIQSTSFKGTVLENLELKEAIVDNVAKTIVIYGIVLQENYIAPGECLIITFKAIGKDVDKMKFTPTTVANQEGIILVSPEAKEIPYEFQGDVRVTSLVPKTFSLSQNYPNPFNATTVIRFALPQDAKLNIEIYNILGQKVRTLIDENMQAGFHSIIWDGTNQQGVSIASGIYFYRLNAGSFQEVKRMTLLK